MYVSVIHRVSDPEGFTKAEDEAIAAGLPDGFSLPIHAATHDHGVGICIWEVRRSMRCAISSSLWWARSARTSTSR